jgi:succinate dehydrogenase / fumarate reductase cytochrome b subunit
MAPASIAGNAESRRGARLQRLHSLSGVVPLGVFVLLHLWITTSIVGSRDVYDRQVGFLHSGAFMGLLEVVLVLVPLAYHGLYGVLRTFQPRDPNHAYGSDVMVALQRVSGVVVLVFVALHTWEFRGQTWTQGLAVSGYATKLVEHLSSAQGGVPWIALGYLVGIAATVFHLVNGMTSFCTTWGYTPTLASQHRARVVFRVLGVVLFAFAAAMVIQLATGSRVFPAEEPKGSALVCGSGAVTPPAPPHATPPASAAAQAPATEPFAAPSASDLPSRDR